MIWQSTSLIDGPVNAHFDATSNTLVAGSETLRFTSTDPTDLRAVDAEGRTYRLFKRSITVARYEAICSAEGATGERGRRYTARRAGGVIERRREIANEAGEPVAVAVGKLNGDLELRPTGGAQVPFLDLAFISWALTYVDAPTRRTLY